MSSIKPILDALRDALLACAPSRVVTRKLEGFAERNALELEVGIFTLISQGEPRIEQGSNILHCLLVGQVLLHEESDGEAIEEAELLMVDDVRRFMDGVQGCQVRMTSWNQSQQVELPYGWITANLEVGPFNFDIGVDESTLNDFSTLASDYDIAPHVSPAEHIKWLGNPPNYTSSKPELQDQQRL